jgi:hypothetical protein
VSDLIKAAQAVVDFVLDLLDQIVTHILDVLAGALSDIGNLLTQPLGDIPIVSWLYTNVICPSDQEEQPSILRLACLVLALPITLIYKFANQMKPPFDDATRDKILSWRFTRPGTPQPEPAALAGLADTDLLPGACAYLSITEACADMAADGIALSAGSPLTQMVGWLDLVVDGLMQVLCWPGKLFDFDWDWASFTQAEKLQRSAWIGGWAPLRRATAATFTAAAPGRPGCAGRPRAASCRRPRLAHPPPAQRAAGRPGRTVLMTGMAHPTNPSRGPRASRQLYRRTKEIHP